MPLYNVYGIKSLYILSFENAWQSWTAMIDTNCKGTMHATAAVLPALTSEENKEGGHIVNISSDAGRKPFAGALSLIYAFT